MPYFTSEDDQQIHYDTWKAGAPKAVIQILTGLGETAQYYEEFAGAALAADCSVYVHEYRKHGKTEAGYGSGVRNLFLSFASDAGRMEEIIRKENPGKKVFLYGHSLGTQIAQIAIAQRCGVWDGLLLTGPSCLELDDRKERLLEEAGEEAGRYGWDGASRLIYPELFNGQNDAFKEEGSPYSFITSDREKWEWIASLPTSSPDYSVRFFRDFVLLQTDLIRRDALEKTGNTSLPVLILCGEKDVTAENGTYGKKKAKALREHGFADVTEKTYPGLRHSLLQEKRRGEVIEDMLSWIEKHTA